MVLYFSAETKCLEIIQPVIYERREKTMRMLLAGLSAAVVINMGETFCTEQDATNCEKRMLIQDSNKEMVAKFYQELFGDKDIDAINRYVAEDYIQHNPHVADGRNALTDACKQWFKNARENTIDIRHIAADGDFVFLHTRSQMGSEIFSIIDIFRIKDDKIVEHWDVIQAVPEKAANSHPMF
jgi:predicted SnoaL-like aldol condensation-catalyzing enzyme